MHVRHLHTLSKLKLARERGGLRHYMKMSIHRRQKLKKSMKTCQNFTQKWNSSKKPLPKQIFTNFGLILGSPGDLKNTKNPKKSKPKKQQKNRWQKTQKNKKKGSKVIGPAEIAGHGEDIGGEKKTSKTAKNDAKKWRQKLKQKIEGKGRLEDEDKMLKRQNLGGGPARRTQGRRNASRILPGRDEWTYVSWTSHRNA